MFAANGPLIEYSDSRVVKIAALIGAVLASLLPILAIVVLHLVKTTETRLGLIVFFSAVFSTLLWFLNDGKLIESVLGDFGVSYLDVASEGSL